MADFRSAGAPEWLEDLRPQAEQAVLGYHDALTRAIELEDRYGVPVPNAGPYIQMGSAAADLLGIVDRIPGEKGQSAFKMDLDTIARSTEEILRLCAEHEAKMSSSTPGSLPSPRD